MKRIAIVLLFSLLLAGCGGGGGNKPGLRGLNLVWQGGGSVDQMRLMSISTSTTWVRKEVHYLARPTSIGLMGSVLAALDSQGQEITDKEVEFSYDSAMIELERWMDQGLNVRSVSPKDTYGETTITGLLDGETDTVKAVIYNAYYTNESAYGVAFDSGEHQIARDNSNLDIYISGGIVYFNYGAIMIPDKDAPDGLGEITTAPTGDYNITQLQPLNQWNRYVFKTAGGKYVKCYTLGARGAVFCVSDTNGVFPY